MNINEIFSSLFEFFHDSVPFSDDLYLENLYSSLGLIDLVVSLFLVISFYFIINNPSFSRWYHWAIILFVNSVIAFFVGIRLPEITFDSLGIEYEWIEYVTFGLKNAIIATIFFVFWTYCLKWWESNAKGIPKLFLGKF